MIFSLLFLHLQDNNKWIENEELHGFLKDLMELIQEVCCSHLAKIANFSS